LQEGCCRKGADCCRNKPIEKTDTEVVSHLIAELNLKSITKLLIKGPLTDWKGIPDYDPTQDVIFPPELKVNPFVTICWKINLSSMIKGYNSTTSTFGAVQKR